MKIKLLVITFFMIAFISCQTKLKESTNVAPESNKKTTLKKIHLLTYDKHITVYEYDADYKDSVSVSDLWFKKDSIVKGGERFYHTLPFESSFIRNEIIKNANGEREFVTFDELMCETGGTSAWNKYLFEYDSQHRPLAAEHYKAWWNEGLGEAPRPEKPQYFLGEKLTYEYGNNWFRQLVYDDKTELIETIEKRFDTQKRLVYEHWDAWDRYRFKAFYEYSNDDRE